MRGKEGERKSIGEREVKRETEKGGVESLSEKGEKERERGRQRYSCEFRREVKGNLERLMKAKRHE